MTNTDKYLLHKKAAAYVEMIVYNEAKIKVTSKMLKHDDEKGYYQNEGDLACAQMCFLEVEYQKIMKELTNKD